MSDEQWLEEAKALLRGIAQGSYSSIQAMYAASGAERAGMIAAIDRAIATLRTVKALSESKGGGC